jgi:hypothetical protein
VIRPYIWTLLQPAYEALMRVPDDDRRVLESEFYLLARHPLRKPAFVTPDLDDLPLATIYVADYMVSYHIDHAVRRVDILEIIAIP